MIRYLLIFLFLLIYSPTVLAADVIALSLREAVGLALKNNPDIVAARYDPEMRKADVVIEKAVFDPLFSLSANQSQSVTGGPSILSGAERLEQRTTDLNATFTQKITTGATYQLQITNERLQTNSSFQLLNPYYTSGLALTVTQPLLKNGWKEVNASKILIARNNEDMSQHQLRATVINTIAGVQNAYWSVVLAREQLDVARLSLKLAEDLLEQNKARLEIGVLAPIEVIVAEAGVASRKTDVIAAEKAVEDAEDTLKKITGLTTDWGIHIRPTDKPSVVPVKFSEQDEIKTALENRPDYIQARIDMKNKEITRDLAGNQTLPDLSFVGSVGLNGLDTTYGSDIARLKSGEYYSWAAGLALTIPIGNRTSKSNLLKARLAEEKAKVNLNNLKEQITLDVRTAVRQVNTTLKTIDAARTARLLAEKQLDAEKDRFDAGMATSHDILTYQEELARAINNENKAIIDYNNAIANLQKVTGTIIEKEGITLLPSYYTENNKGR